MVSLTFFVFVALIVAVGFFAATWRKKNKVPLDPDATQKNSERIPRSNSAFNEPSTNHIKGGMVPTDNKLAQNDFDDENEVIK